VVSRTTAMRYRRTTRTLPQVARELNVDALVEGLVVRDGSRVRVTARLFAAEGRTDLDGGLRADSAHYVSLACHHHSVKDEGSPVYRVTTAVTSSLCGRAGGQALTASIRPVEHARRVRLPASWPTLPIGFLRASRCSQSRPAHDGSGVFVRAEIVERQALRGLTNGMGARNAPRAASRRCRQCGGTLVISPGTSWRCASYGHAENLLGLDLRQGAQTQPPDLPGTGPPSQEGPTPPVPPLHRPIAAKAAGSGNDEASCGFRRRRLPLRRRDRAPSSTATRHRRGWDRVS